MGVATFTVGHVHFYWFGLSIAVSLLIWLGVTVYLAHHAKISAEPVLDILLCVVPGAVIFARIVYVLIHWRLYQENLWSVLFLWHGGLSMPGAVLGGLLSFFLAIRWLKLEPLYWVDLVSPGMAFGIAAGQSGDFFCQRNFGYPTDSPWGIYIDFAMRPPGFEQYDFFQPVFLYAFAWYLAAAFLITLAWLLCRRNTCVKPGSVFLLYVFLYFSGHYYLDSMVLSGNMTGVLATGPIFNGTMAAVSLVLLVARTIIAMSRR